MYANEGSLALSIKRYFTLEAQIDEDRLFSYVCESTIQNSMEGKEGGGHHKHIGWNCALLRAFVSHVRRSLRLGSTPPPPFFVESGAILIWTETIL